MQPEKKRYLGDTVYAELENGMLVLTVEDGDPEEGVSQVIYMEPEVVGSLLQFIEDFADEL